MNWEQIALILQVYHDSSRDPTLSHISTAARKALMEVKVPAEQEDDDDE